MKVQHVDNMLIFECPGCDCCHAIDPTQWKWNGSVDAPTFSPSILVRSTKLTEKGWAEHATWMTEGGPAPDRLDCIDTVCHSYVQEGRIRFLGDCTHFLAGQTVDLPEIL